jgi:hypothetical protein
MKPSLIVGALAGYVLGTRAGRQRYEDIVRLTRRVAGSQPVQSATGAINSQAHDIAGRAKDRVLRKIPLIHHTSGEPIYSGRTKSHLN